MTTTKASHRTIPNKRRPNETKNSTLQDFRLSHRIAQVVMMEYLSLDDFIFNDNNNGIASNDPKDKKSQRNQELYTALLASLRDQEFDKCS